MPPLKKTVLGKPISDEQPVASAPVESPVATETPPLPAPPVARRGYRGVALVGAGILGLVVFLAIPVMLVAVLSRHRGTDAFDLMAEFQRDELAAEKKYTGVEITVSGIVGKTAPPDMDLASVDYYVTLSPGVTVFWKEGTKPAKPVKVGDRVTVIGKIVHYNIPSRRILIMECRDAN